MSEGAAGDGRSSRKGSTKEEARRPTNIPMTELIENVAMIEDHDQKVQSLFLTRAY